MTPRDFSLDTLLRANAAIHAQREACIDGAQRLTYAQLDRRVYAMAHWLLARA